MTDWKEGVMREYHILERGKQMVEEEMAKNPSLSKLRTQIKNIQRELTEREEEYKVDINNCDFEMQKIRDDLIGRWDIEGKSFKCDEGSVTIKTTKSLVVTNNSGLIQRLTVISEDVTKACDCIRSFNLSAIRKYMDADLIDERIAHYDEKRNVIISSVKKEGGTRDEE